MTDTLSLPAAGKPRRERSPAAMPAAPETSSAAGSTKLEQIVAMLSRPEGASLAELVAATNWQPHSVRGALAGSLKRKGFTIVSEKIAGERRYRIEAGK
jgi:hypothetical protein